MKANSSFRAKAILTLLLLFQPGGPPRAMEICELPKASQCLENGRKGVVPGKGKYKEHSALWASLLLLLEIILHPLQNKEGMSHQVENPHHVFRSKGQEAQLDNSGKNCPTEAHR